MEGPGKASVLPTTVGFREVTDKSPQLEKKRLLKRICAVTKRKIKEKLSTDTREE